MNFENHFSTEQIVRCSCGYRIKNSRPRHEQHRLHGISLVEQAPEQPREFDLMFPPRRIWLRPTSAERRRLGPTKTNELALFKTVTAQLEQSAAVGVQWAVDLKAYIADIQGRAFADEIVLWTPTIWPREKGEGSHRYRALSMYPPQDKIIIGEATRYLGQRIDSQLAAQVYGQRLGFATKALSHHDAVAALHSFRQRHQRRRLWVSELDLRGFFDCVSHQEIRKALSRAVSNARVCGLKIDPRAIRIVEAYLRSYSFATVAVPGAQQWFDCRDPDGRLEIPTRELEQIWGANIPIDLGIPQGGALSGLLSNLVLDSADRAVLGPTETSDPDMFYSRYVDDIVIAHPDRRKCEAAFQRLQAALLQLKLPTHRPCQVRDYNAKSKRSGENQYWGNKSRAPYRWEKKGTTKASVPWVQFLGYQIRDDGLLRIRPSSIKKQLLRQVEEVDTICGVLGRSRRMPRQNFRRVAWKALLSYVFLLNAIVSGRGSFDTMSGWSGGFRLLRGKSHVVSQLRALDRGRARQLRRLIRHVLRSTGTVVSVPLLTRLRRESTSYEALFKARSVNCELR